MSPKERFSRSAALLGDEAMDSLSRAKVLVVGVGGVGSWCAEALVRTGVGAITLVDDDEVVESNLNRQCPATVDALGEKKVDALRRRLLSINPACVVEARTERFPGEKSEALNWQLGEYDAVVDAIDDVAAKAELMLLATDQGVNLFSSMGAALRMDPTRIRVDRFEKVLGDGLAKALRQRFKRMERFPSRRISCVWSEERPLAVRERGSLMQVTATFGMCLASEVIKCLTGR